MFENIIQLSAKFYKVLNWSSIATQYEQIIKQEFNAINLIIGCHDLQTWSALH